MTDVLLSVDHVTKRFGGLVAVNDVSLEVRRGEIVGLIGPNGAGKTTLFGCVVGLLHPTSGAVTFAGRRMDRLSQHAVVRKGICHSHQIPAPFADLSVRAGGAAGTIEVVLALGSHRQRVSIESRCCRP